MRPKDLTPTEQLVLIHLANFANEERQCWPSHAILAKRTGFSERTIFAVLKALEGKNILRRESRARPDGSRSTDIITLIPETNALATPPETVARGVGKQLRGGGETVATLNLSGNLPFEDSEANASVGTADEVRRAFEEYNLVATASGCSIAMKLTDARKRHLRARLRECGGLSGWTLALTKMQESPYLTGKTPERFYASLDFITKPEKFTMLLEGRYAVRLGINSRQQAVADIDAARERAFKMLREPTNAH